MGKYIKLYPECLERKKKKNDSLTDPSDKHEYVEIGGLKWATMNIGATSVADNGTYFRWGEVENCDYIPEMRGTWEDYKYATVSGSEVTITKYNSTDGLTTLEPSDDAATVLWGGNWRMPTQEECKTLLNSTNKTFVDNYENTNVAGMLFIDKNNTENRIFFPRNFNCGISNYSPMFYIWASSINNTNIEQAVSLMCGKSTQYIFTGNIRRIDSCCNIRPVAD